MASYFVRLLALVISIFSFWVAWKEPKLSNEFIWAGCFFLALFVAAFLERKYLLFCLGVIFVFPVWLGYVSGAVIGFGRRASEQVLAQNPAGFWLTMGLWSVVAIGLISYGVYHAFFQKKP